MGDLSKQQSSPGPSTSVNDVSVPDSGTSTSAAPECVSPAEVARLLLSLEGAAQNLARDLSDLSKHWQEVMQTSGESAVDHLGLYDSAAVDVEQSVVSCIDAGQRMLRGCLTLHEEIRGMDLLAARVKSVKMTLHELESIAKPILR
mmetsp:Transcript_18952/g.52866  ORF Transcript_18952/g.52866 Transcript_18952/m.52866 type:complete len:146 (+) Transcript_18952:118-555(+)